MGGLCTQGKAPTVHQIRGDGNCYFCAISYSICGEERYYAALRNVCVTLFQPLMEISKPFLTRGKGKEYIQSPRLEQMQHGHQQ